MNLLGLKPEAYRRAWQVFTTHIAELEMVKGPMDPADRAQLWREWTANEHFHEMPVPMEHFCTDPWYIGQGVRVRPKIRETLGTFWDIDSQKELLLFIAGIGSGKSFSGALSLDYGLYLVSCLKRPASWMSTFPGVSLSDDSEIVFMTASAAGAEQSAKIVYGEVYERVTNSPYFKEHFAPDPRKSSELEFPNSVRLSPGSSSYRTALGWNVFGFVIDEAALGVTTETMDYVRELFNALNQRRKSRFGSLGFGMLLTSPGNEGAYVEGLAAQGLQEDHTIQVSRMTTWEAKDELKPGTKVFLLDRDPEKLRVVAKDLYYVRPGYLQDAAGNTFRYKDGDHPETWSEAEEAVAA